jgi:hypothetical protein
VELREKMKPTKGKRRGKQMALEYLSGGWMYSLDGLRKAEERFFHRRSRI